MAGVAVSASGPGDIGAELAEIAEQLRAAPAAIVAAVAPVARAEILAAVASARGGRLTVSGLGVTLDVETRVEGGGDQAAAHLEATPAGAWALVDDGARPHTIRSARGMPAPPHGVFDRVNHPGSPGANVWQPGVARAETATDAAADEVFERLLPGD